MVAVYIDPDIVLSDAHVPAILGPGPNDSCRAWVVYFPRDTPVICNNFTEAAETMLEWLRKQRRYQAAEKKP